MGLMMTETTATTAGAGASEGALRLETTSLRFSGVLHGGSQAKPIRVSASGDSPPVLDVIAPPLAPFSITGHPGRFVADRRSTETGHLITELWIRYDATSPMADDRGRLTIAHPVTGTRWTIELHGTGILADRRHFERGVDGR